MFKILTDLDINLQREKTFEDLRGLENGYLRFDFVYQLVMITLHIY